MNNKKKKPTKKSHGLVFVRKKISKKLPLFYVEWTDHAISSKNQWTDVDAAKVLELHCVSVGFQVDETNDAIALAQNVGENGSVAEVMTILKSCITKKVKL
jgi:hypothetical protein